MSYHFLFKKEAVIPEALEIPFASCALPALSTFGNKMQIRTINNNQYFILH